MTTFTAMRYSHWNAASKWVSGEVQTDTVPITPTGNRRPCVGATMFQTGSSPP
ncbi:hypothetical protein [Nitrosospira briensis]|uniref:hypothetical protein n=1 Tax=Nitrosospira briensis TaxID=35799 RepID=UPI0015A66C4A|nr:hypothetical protein [Nitrosospira briensis]